MIRSLNLLITLGVATALWQFAALAPSLAEGESAPPGPPISAAQFKKLEDYMVENGKIVTADTNVSDALGLTRNGEFVASRALTVKERDSGVMHQIQHLPNDRGFLVGHIDADTMDVYWADKNLGLIAAVTRVWGMLTFSIPPAKAKADYGKELAYWANVADTL